MAKPSHAVVAPVDVDALAGKLREAFRLRIGGDRYAVWFGDAAQIHVQRAASGRRSRTAGAAWAVSMTAGSGFAHDWLRRTFDQELRAVAGEVCGTPAEVSWRPAPDPAPGQNVADRAIAPQGTQAEPSASPASRRRRQTTVVRDERPASSPPTPPAGAALVRRSPPSLAEFVVGPSNRMAYGAVELAATRPGEMSPLVIHGPSGVGKTHLLEAICGRVRELHPTITAVSLSAEQFTTGFLQALHGSGLPAFRRGCRQADLLAVDDLQFFVGKRATLLELQQTVDALQRQGKQIVFTSDRELDALPGLGADLLTRLRGGMTARILPPDFEVRCGIVAAVCGKRGLDVPVEVVQYVATHMTRHARELIGAVNRLEATSLMLGVAITPEMAEEALADLVRSSARSVRLADVERAVCTAFGIEPGSLQTSRRGRTLSHPRMLAMYLARKHTHAALADIGTFFGRRSHSTVIAAQKSVQSWVERRSPVVLAESAWDVEEAIRRVEDLLRAG
jgi:chromosomal replication initiator protein